MHIFISNLTVSGMAVDSEASFKSRVLELGISQVHYDLLAARNVKTFAGFAFVSAYQPNSQDEKPFVDALTDILGAAPGDMLPVYRRLFYESHTLAIQDLRTRLESRDSQEPRKLAMPERMDRLGRLKAALPGITMDAQMEPSHALVDRVVAMAEEQSVYYIDLSLCTSRESEVNMLKKEPILEFAADGSIKLAKKNKEASADVAGELRVRMCMQRRSLAFEMANIATYQALEEFTAKIFGMITRKPISGFRSISLSQVVAADQALWQVVAQETRGKILTVGSPKPIDAAVTSAKDSAEVMYHLLPLRDNKRALDDDSDKDKKKKKKDDKKKKKTDDDKPPKKTGPGKVDLPAGCSARNEANQNICFAFNRKSCAVRGARCRRGLHVCWKVGCYGKHAWPDCNANKAE